MVTLEEQERKNERKKKNKKERKSAGTETFQVARSWPPQTVSGGG